MGTPQGRYSRQELFPPIGRGGQDRLRAARVLVTGCGGLGSNSADLLARAGVRMLRIVDRDFVELSNLQRQALFSEADALEGVPKAVAAARRIAALNSEVAVEPVVADIEPANVLRLLDGVDLVVDGFDNFEGRYIVNDACVKRGMPWIYGACVGSTAMAGLLVPGVTSCLRCLRRDLPPPGAVQTCDMAGIIGPAASLAATLQVSFAMRFLVGGAEAVPAGIVSADAWDLGMQTLPLPPRNHACPCCGGAGRFEFLEAAARPAASLCGRDAVQVRALSSARPDFAALAERLRPMGQVHVTDFLLRFKAPPYELTVFDDGRAIVKGTGDVALARGLVARWIGV